MHNAAEFTGETNRLTEGDGFELTLPLANEPLRWNGRCPEAKRDARKRHLS
jgi:hypothetical protein